MLRIASGDIIDVDTLLTNTPRGLEARRREARRRSGVAARDRRDRHRQGPGGHILTGPVFVEGAEPGDALEVKILSIDLPIAYGYNGCSGFLRENCERAPARTIILPLDRETMTATFAPGIVIPLKPFFGSMGVAPPPEAGRVSSNPPGTHAGNLDNRELVAGTTLSSRCTCRARCSRSATATPRRATAKSIRPRSRRRCAAGCSSPCART